MNNRIGPQALYMSLWFIMYSPVTWLCALAVGSMVVPLALDLHALPAPLLWVLMLAARFHVGTFALGLLVLHSAVAFVRGYTTMYQLDDNALVVAHGYLSPYARAGWFRRDINTIPLNFVDDADFTQTIVQQAAKVGCVTVRTVQGEKAFLPFVEDPEAIRAAIMQRCGVAKTRVFARVET